MFQACAQLLQSGCICDFGLMCPCLAGVGWSREWAMPEGLHLSFGSRARCPLDPLRATPSHRLIWQLGCDHRLRDRWAANTYSCRSDEQCHLTAALRYLCWGSLRQNSAVQQALISWHIAGVVGKRNLSANLVHVFFVLFVKHKFKVGVVIYLWSDFKLPQAPKPVTNQILCINCKAASHSQSSWPI